MLIPEQHRIFKVALAVVIVTSISVTNQGLAAPRVTTTHRGDWWITESQNFNLWTKSSSEETTEIIHHCERLRHELQEKWIDPNSPSHEPWTLPCVVVIHSSVHEYARAVPPHAANSSGCTTVTVDAGRVIFRRIDLRTDSLAWRENALPHELTHVVLADRFPEGNLPPWLNEGLATLAESETLKHRRKNVLQTAWQSGTVPSLKTLMTAEQTAASVNVDVLYACRSSLLKFLEGERDHASLTRFVQQVVETDCNHALRSVYEFENGLAELEQRWLRCLERECVSIPRG
ncbi:MAG TPA: hypothetical protein VNQ76_06585 [Planctomicrobium sp.]|nr:hypothetical protein [Planctomicrobium sp.]